MGQDIKGVGNHVLRRFAFRQLPQGKGLGSSNLIDNFTDERISQFSSHEPGCITESSSRRSGADAITHQESGSPTAWAPTSPKMTMTSSAPIQKFLRSRSSLVASFGWASMIQTDSLDAASRTATGT